MNTKWSVIRLLIFFCSFYKPPACNIIKRIPNCIGSCHQCCRPEQIKSQCGCFCCVKETKNQRKSDLLGKSDALTNARMLDMLQWLLLSMSSKMPCRWTYIILCHKRDTSPKVWDLASNCPCSHDLWPSDGAEGGQTVSQLTVCHSAFGTWWHTVTHGRGSEGERCDWSG